MRCLRICRIYCIYSIHRFSEWLVMPDNNRKKQKFETANLRQVDLNLLVGLRSLLSTRSVTEAARDIGVTQPAMSNILARLRALLDDPILVRGPDGHVLTEKAAELEMPLYESLRAVEGLLLSKR